MSTRVVPYSRCVVEKQADNIKLVIPFQYHTEGNMIADTTSQRGIIGRMHRIAKL